MSSTSRCDAAIIGTIIASVMKLHGGTALQSIQSKLRENYGRQRVRLTVKLGAHGSLTLGEYSVADESFRRPTALKHGAFSKTVLFPWEDVEEFEALHRSLQDEWKPSGALEEDAVFTMLTCIWRKRRIRDKRNLDTLASMQEQEFEELTAQPLPFFETSHENTLYVLKNRPNSTGVVRDKVSQLLGFSSSLYGRLDGQSLEVSISMMGKEF